MKMKFLVVVALLFTVFMTSSSDINPKILVGKWCNPYTYLSSGEIKGFNFKRNGKCESLHSATLDLKTWEIKNGKLIIKGFQIAEDGTKTDYRREEKIEKLTEDELLIVAREEEPKVFFKYVRVENVKEFRDDREAL